MVNRNEEKLVCDCNFSGIKPAVMDLPYPQVRVRERNQDYAGLIGVSYCGMISELSACLQYINNESRMVSRGCAMGKILLGMAVAEMQHMQMLAGLIDLLGGSVCYTAKQAGGQPWMWTPQCLTLPDRPDEMLQADLEREIAVIDQYHAHIQMIRDDYVTAVLGRIVQDEQYHIMLLRSMMDTM
ncbi:MAG: rubrerythrin family protein [Lachnospiraceae bacterium]